MVCDKGNDSGQRKGRRTGGGGEEYTSDAMMTACSIAPTSEQLSGRSPQAYDQDEERHDLLCSPAQN